ncbi:MAG: hypothetical protein R3B41_00435 [Candidatus Doudnabacteria bacterium]
MNQLKTASKELEFNYDEALFGSIDLVYEKELEFQLRKLSNSQKLHSTKSLKNKKTSRGNKFRGSLVCNLN